MIQNGPQLGTLGSNLRLGVNRYGTLIPSHRNWTIGFVIGADDRWRDPHEEPSTRQRFLSGTPVVETAISVPGGAVRWRVAVANGPIGIVEIHNDSPGATAVGVVVRSDFPISTLSTEISVDGGVCLRLPRPMTFGAAGKGERSALDVVLRGAAERQPRWQATGPDAELVVLLPLGHGATVSMQVILDRDDPIRVQRPSLKTIVQGWEQHLLRGTRVVLPDPVLDAGTTVARALTMLASGIDTSPLTLRVLEDWGLDAEAAAAWENARVRQRWAARKTRKRVTPDLIWDSMVRVWRSMQGAPFLGEHAGRASDWLNLVHALLVNEHGRGEVELLQHLPAEWAGAPLEVYNIPLRGGFISYAIRWHGIRPALLWESTGVRKITIPGIDPTFSTTEASGEFLLQPPPRRPQMTELGATFS